jgi:hypothetical protein
VGKVWRPMPRIMARGGEAVYSVSATTEHSMGDEWTNGLQEPIDDLIDALVWIERRGQIKTRRRSAPL